VVNPAGQPVAKADVVAYDVTRGSRGPRPHAVTDEAGNFEIAGLEAGTYYMSAQKESEGYASTIDGFHSAGLITVPSVSVTDNQVVEGIILHLGPKSGRLTGKIVDTRTKSPIQQAAITLRRADNPEQFYGTSSESKFSLLVPAVPFTIDVEAKGYKKWTYTDASGKHVLRLTSGQRKELTISLDPNPPIQSKP